MAAVRLQSAEPAPVAVVSASRDAKGLEVMDLLYLKLAERQDLVLVERDRLDAVLRERALAMGLGHDTAMAVGAALGARLFVVVQSPAEGASVTSVTVFETTYGRRVADEILSCNLADAGAATEIAAGIERVRRKLAEPTTRTVALLPGRCVGLAPEKELIRRALQRLVVRRLVASPACVVLEREHLSQVDAEGLAAPGAQSAGLPAASVLIALDLSAGRGQNPPRLEVHQMLPGAISKVLARFDVPTDGLNKAAQSAAEDVLQALTLAAPPEQPAVALAAEAGHFRQEANLLLLQGRPSEAVAAAHAAFALDPLHPVCDGICATELAAVAKALPQCDADPALLSEASLWLNHGLDLLDAECAAVRRKMAPGEHWRTMDELARMAIRAQVTAAAFSLDLYRQGGGCNGRTFQVADPELLRQMRARLGGFLSRFMQGNLDVVRRDGDAWRRFPRVDPWLGEQKGLTNRWGALQDIGLGLDADRIRLSDEWLRLLAETPAPQEKSIAGSWQPFLRSLLVPELHRLLWRTVGDASRQAWSSHVRLLAGHPCPLVSLYGELAAVFWDGEGQLRPGDEVLRRAAELLPRLATLAKNPGPLDSWVADPDRLVYQAAAQLITSAAQRANHGGGKVQNSGTWEMQQALLVWQAILANGHALEFRDAAGICMRRIEYGRQETVDMLTQTCSALRQAGEEETAQEVQQRIDRLPGGTAGKATGLATPAPWAEAKCLQEIPKLPGRQTGSILSYAFAGELIVAASPVFFAAPRGAVVERIRISAVATDGSQGRLLADLPVPPADGSFRTNPNTIEVKCFDSDDGTICVFLNGCLDIVPPGDGEARRLSLDAIRAAGAARAGFVAAGVLYVCFPFRVATLYAVDLRDSTATVLASAAQRAEQSPFGGQVGNPSVVRRSDDGTDLIVGVTGGTGSQAWAMDLRSRAWRRVEGGYETEATLAVGRVIDGWQYSVCAGGQLSRHRPGTQPGTDTLPLALSGMRAHRGALYGWLGQRVMRIDLRDVSAPVAAPP
jgi:hypothetical protein